MADHSETEFARPETIHARPTLHQLIIAVVVLIGAGVATLLSGPGFGVLVLTLAAVAAALWMSYGGPKPTPTPTPAAAASSAASVAVPGTMKPARERRSTDWARIRASLDISLDRATVLALAPAALVIAAMAAYFYARDLRTNPPNLFSDEAMIGLQAAGAFNGEAKFQFLRIFYTHFETPLLGALPVYSTWPFVTLFGLNEFSVRFASSFYVALGLFFAFLALRRLKVPYPIVPVVIAGTQPVVIHFARINFGHAAAFCLMLAAIWLWIRGRQNEQVSQAILAGFVMGVASYGHLSFVIAVPLVVTIICISELVWNRTNLRAYRWIVAFGATAVVTMLPHAWLALTDKRYWDRLDEKQGGNITPDILVERLRTYPSFFSYDYLFRKGEEWYITRHSIVGAGELFPYLLPLLLIGIVSIWFLRKQPETRFLFVFALIALLYPIPDAISRPPQDLPYTISTFWAAIAIPFLVGSSFKGIALFLRRIRMPRALALAGTGVLLLALGWGIWFHRGPEAEYPLISADYWGWQYGPRPINDYFVNHSDQYDELLQSGDFNGAYVFPQFYLYHTPLASRARIGGVENIDFTKRSLIAMRVEEWERYRASQFPGKDYLILVDTIYYPNGDPAFYLMTVDPMYLTLPTPAPETEAPAG
ncbi:MAG: glycosyltransferase family 39 protein [Thermomicrobiales bacterium]